jgi:hypothetical protein
VGEILRYVLEATEIATGLDAAGIGDYSDLPSSPATATIALSGETLGTATVDDGGSGYGDAPRVYFKGGGGAGARARAVVVGGAVDSIAILEGGSGYSSGDVSVTFRGGGGTGAVAGSVTVSSGAVTAIAVSAGGSGYSAYAPPEVVVEWASSTPAATASVSSGVVTGISVTDSGAGFTTAPEVWISPLPLATLGDLARLDVIPTQPVVVQGERVLQALQGVLAAWQPNHWIHVEPGGTIRVVDGRAGAVSDLTLGGSDSPPVDPAGVQMSRTIQGCAGRLIVRGGPAITGTWLSLTGTAGSASVASTVQSSPVATTTGCAGGSGLAADDSYYVGWTVRFTSGLSAGQTRTVATYTGSTRVFTWTNALAYTPNLGDGFRVYSPANGNPAAAATTTVQASPTPTSTVWKGATSLSATNDYYNGWVCEVLSGDLQGQKRIVADYVGSTRTVTLATALEAAPAAGVSMRLRTKGNRLEEYFDWGGLTDEAAIKAGWSLADYSDSSGTAQDRGDCTCPSTTEVEITTAKNFTANQLDQTAGGQKGQVILCDNIAQGIASTYSAKVVANTARSAGKVTLTLDRVLPATSYDSYQLFYESPEGQVVWRRYRPEDEALRDAMGRQFAEPQRVDGGGDSASLTLEPVMLLVKQGITAIVPCVVDPDAGTITAARPVVTFFGPVLYEGATPTADQTPDDVQVLLPIVDGSLHVVAPSDNSGEVYAGSVVAETGRSETLTITVPSWTDNSNLTAMREYAWQVLDTIRDPIVEGTVPVLGWDSTFYAPGQLVQLKGNGFATPWQHQAVPVVAVEVELYGTPVRYRTRLQLSSQRQAFAAAVFERPAPTGLVLGGYGLIDVSPADLAPKWGGYAGAINPDASPVAYINPAVGRIQQAAAGSYLGPAMAARDQLLGNATGARDALLGGAMGARDALLGGAMGARDALLGAASGRPTGPVVSRNAGPTRAERVAAHKSPSGFDAFDQRKKAEMGSMPYTGTPSPAQQQRTMRGIPVGEPGGATPSASQRYGQSFGLPSAPADFGRQAQADMGTPDIGTSTPAQQQRTMRSIPVGEPGGASPSATQRYEAAAGRPFVPPKGKYTPPPRAATPPSPLDSQEIDTQAMTPRPVRRDPPFEEELP